MPSAGIFFTFIPLPPCARHKSDISRTIKLPRKDIPNKSETVSTASETLTSFFYANIAVIKTESAGIGIPIGRIYFFIIVFIIVFKLKFFSSTKQQNDSPVALNGKSMNNITYPRSACIVICDSERSFSQSQRSAKYNL